MAGFSGLMKVGLAVLPVLAGVWSVGKQPAATFKGDVMPIFKADCVTCHNGEKAYGGLRLDSYEGLMKGGVSGPSVVVGKSGESELVRRLRGTDGVAQMPKGFRPLEDAEIAKVVAWIDEGAKNDGSAPVHWSYVAPVRPVVPVLGNRWVQNPIDAFVFVKLKEKGFSPSTEADKSTLVRRVYLDVLGMPPTVEEAREFLDDKKSGAYARMVDRVLASPHYGERQARIWLDLARYADSQGYEKDANRSMWPWRDWVIKAFNSNMRFDEFTVEQIAGDLLPGATMDQIVATGFNRNTMINEEGGVDQGEARWLTQVDRVGTLGTVWLGSTVACAQCHDHKYDPVSQEDFYKFLAYFENSEEPVYSLTPEIEARKADIGKQVEALNAEIGKAGLDPSKKKELEGQRDALNAENAKLVNVTTLVFQPKKDVAAEAPVRQKGMFLNPGKVVRAGTPEFLGPGPKATPIGGRYELGQWLVSRTNPLTARVQVNRMWEQHFGVGIVKTSEDFGTQGAAPVNKDLLDWLAVEFMESGWDMKHMHRLILNSAAYRQSSVVSKKALEWDPENQLTTRGPRFRLEAEAIRDSVLTVSGLLVPKLGGPSVMPYQPDGVWDTPYNGQTWTVAAGEDKYRRSLYTFWKRSSPYPMFLNFDGTSREACTPRRIRTNTPLQALNMLNDRGLLEGAVAMARSVSGSDASKGVDTLFVRCLVRKPNASERTALSGLFERRKKAFESQLDEAAKLCGSRDAELAAWTLVANVLMNTDEFLSLE